MSFELAQHAMSRDPILIALAQNGPFRLQCDKATIWSVDGLSQHVVAEAGPLSALCSPQQPSSHATSLNQLIKESLHVFTAATTPTDDTSDTIVNHTRHVIRDVSSRESLKFTSSVVTSYAAVPILGACGQLLGCYCVTDKDIRDDFSAEQTYTVLDDVACAISQYLGQQATASSRPRGRCDRQTPILNDASSLSPDSSERSLFTGSSCDDTTPLTTPNEAPEFTFDLPMPAKPDHPSTPTTFPLSSSSNATEGVPTTVGQAMKSDFVSSLSHELRSPLHGCLAAAELLRETKLDATQTDLVTMVQACSSTLLYTLNHVLDFSKINDSEAAKDGRRRASDISPSKASQNIFGQTSEDYLCRLTQDVVEGVHFGHTMQEAAHNKTTSTPLGHHAESHLDPAMLLDEAVGHSHTSDGVAVFLFMESHEAWFSMICAGAWKRLVMNLFGNSLKFCSAGHIEVTLKMIPDPKNPRRRMAHLMVLDTGIGMREEFSKHGIFQPFVQENPLVNGTGLGLHIVKRIVDDMQGTIQVQSTLGSGTRFDVTIPIVELETPPSETPLDGGQILDPPGILHNRTICLLTSTQGASGHADSRRTPLVHSYVRNIAEDWYHMNVFEADMSADVEADLYVAEASDFAMHACTNDQLSRIRSQQRRTVIVGTPSQLAQVEREFSANVVELSYPLGPRALVRALYAALDRPDDLVFPTPPAAAANTLPGYMELDPIEPQPKDLPAAKQEAIHPDPTQQHLLLVDDNAINLKLLSTFVKKLNFNAETAIDGQDALTKYKSWSKKHAFTTILMDISMPKMNGFESSRAIREFEVENGLQPAKIIALTALSSEASRREAEANGIDDFQMKPVSLKTLKGLFPEAA
ncbi:hypothetical protein D6D12_10378 [Aureobasidium pullulans]|uniref:histidine kinase n=1 Tax=Aureobasidium pullulans TaxID=5580 RepID=A0AB74JE69_AURPU|nr:hypothetical protein D6D12_10378 [Aureobasidium pullulans]THX53445.1 hypothetical protein D6D11_04451 [Aureobasidium pullulans]